MRALVTGAAGQLGQDLATILSSLSSSSRKGASGDRSDIGDPVILTDLRALLEHHIEALDITDARAVDALVDQARPDVIFHGAAWTNVDGAEDNVAACTAVNVTGTHNVAQAAEAVGAKLIAVSTDYVFDGEKSDGYTEDNEPNPLGVYGRTKRDGEVEALKHCSRTFVVRSAWLYGPKYERIEVKNFPKTMKRLAAERLSRVQSRGSDLTVVNDQIGSPTFTFDLAQALIQLAETDDYGIWHIVNSGTASWYDFAREILKDEIEAGLTVRPIPSSEYPTKATRPKHSILDTSKFAATFGPLRNWSDALAEYQQSQVVLSS